MSNLSEVSTSFASDASAESNADSSNGSSKRKSQRQSGVNDSGFVTRDVNDSGTENISSTSTTSTDSNLTADLSPTPSDSSSTKRARKNPNPKRRPKVAEEIDHLQRTTNLVIPRAPFARIVREIVHGIDDKLKIQKQAFEALQESAEMYLVQTFEDALLLTEHRRCVTVEARDLKLVQRIQTPSFRSQNNGNVNSEATMANEANGTNFGGDDDDDNDDDYDENE